MQPYNSIQKICRMKSALFLLNLQTGHSLRKHATTPFFKTNISNAFLVHIFTGYFWGPFFPSVKSQNWLFLPVLEKWFWKGFLYVQYSNLLPHYQTKYHWHFLWKNLGGFELSCLIPSSANYVQSIENELLSSLILRMLGGNRISFLFLLVYVSPMKVVFS